MRPTRDRLHFRSAVCARRISISDSGFWIAVGIGNRLATAANDTTDGAADVAIDVAERGCHESTEVCDGEERQRDADDGVDDRDYLTPCSLGRYVPVTSTAQSAT